jgi:histone H3/H4
MPPHSAKINLRPKRPLIGKDSKKIFKLISPHRLSKNVAQLVTDMEVLPVEEARVTYSLHRAQYQGRRTVQARDYEMAAAFLSRQIDATQFYVIERSSAKQAGRKPRKVKAPITTI